MSILRRHLAYGRYIARHKWFVLQAGLKTKAPIWRLLIHDWSKLTPAEWLPYVAKFYGIKYIRGSIPWELVNEHFDAAWLHHQHRNPHHHQHWVLREDDGEMKVLRMPDKLVREMVADWMGAGRAITGRWEVAEWYVKNSEKMVLHSDVREQVEQIIENVSALA